MKGRIPGQKPELARHSRLLLYIATLKAHKAARLLKQHYTKDEAAELCGYANTKYMMTCIRKYIPKKEAKPQ